MIHSILFCSCGFSWNLFLKKKKTLKNGKIYLLVLPFVVQDHIFFFYISFWEVQECLPFWEKTLPSF